MNTHSKHPEKIYLVQALNDLTRQAIESAKNDQFKNINEHPDMECRSRSGTVIRRTLYEVPQDVLIQLRGKKEMQFMEYGRVKGSLPTESEIRLVEVCPFKKARKNRRENPPLSMPGLMRGSDLFRRRIRRSKRTIAKA